MTDRLDQLLRALPAPGLDHPLDQLEPAVWARIEAGRAPCAPAGLRIQLAAAALALVVGLAFGWSLSQHQAHDPQADYAGYAAVGPLARLESGL